MPLLGLKRTESDPPKKNLFVKKKNILRNFKIMTLIVLRKTIVNIYTNVLEELFKKNPFLQYLLNKFNVDGVYRGLPKIFKKIHYRVEGP